jgi:two-component system sensor histidine kinase KdpD
LRKCAELADGLDASWYAVSVDPPGEELTAPDGAKDVLALAKELGGVPSRLKSSDLVGSIAVFVAEYGITHVLVGRTRQPWYRRWFGRSVLGRLLRTLHGVDVTVVDST